MCFIAWFDCRACRLSGCGTATHSQNRCVWPACACWRLPLLQHSLGVSPQQRHLKGAWVGLQCRPCSQPTYMFERVQLPPLQGVWCLQAKGGHLAQRWQRDGDVRQPLHHLTIARVKRPDFGHCLIRRGLAELRPWCMGWRTWRCPCRVLP